MAREHLVLTKLYCHNNYLTHRRKHLVLMKSTYLTLFGSVRMKLLIETCLVHNRQNNWLSTRHCFSAFCTVRRYLSEIISHYYAAHWLCFAVLLFIISYPTRKGLFRFSVLMMVTILVRLITTQ